MKTEKSKKMEMYIIGTLIKVLISNRAMKCDNCGMEISDLRIKTDKCCRWVVMR